MTIPLIKFINNSGKGKFILNVTSLISGFLLVLSQINILLGSLSVYNPVSKEGTPSTILTGTAAGFIIGAFALVLLLTTYWHIRRTKTNIHSPVHTRTIFDYFLHGCVLASGFIICTHWQFLAHAYVADSLHARAALWLIPGCYIIYPSLIARGNVILIPLISLILLPALFIVHTNATALFSDDHGSVMYRLQLLRDYFPQVPVYNTEWNGGTDWRDFFATGILNVYLLFYPLFQIFSVDSAYSLAVIMILFLVLPLSVYFGARILSFSQTAAIFSALLSVTASSAWYKWSLSYGSMGFVCSTALFPLLFALAVHTLQHKGETPKAYLLLLVCIGTLCLFWSAQGLSLIPVLLIAFTKAKFLLSHSRIRWTLAALLIINIPWMLLFVTVSKVGSFVQVESVENNLIKSDNKLDDGAVSEKGAVVKGKTKAIQSSTVIKAFRDNASKIHPLLLLLTVPALLTLFLDRNSRYNLGLPLFLTGIWLFFLSTVAVHIKPQLELDRMMLIASILMCIPVGAIVAQLLNPLTEHCSRATTALTRLNGSIVFSLLALGVLTSASTLQNRSWEKYKLVDESLGSLSRLIADHKGSGRTLFSGFILHELGGGHIAPLARLSGAPIVASSPVHNLWWYTDVIPEEYRKLGPAGIETYLDLMNVSLVIAHEKVWKDYFRNSSFRYDEIGIVDRFVAFRRNGGPDTYFVAGQGKILSQDGDGLRLVMESDSAILKFNYYPFLEATNCQAISSHKVSSSINFISLEGCPANQQIHIKSVNPFRRLFY